jgi:hypothetical protein
MPDRPLFTDEAAVAGAVAVGVSIADSGASPPVVGKLRLFDGTLVPTTGTTRTDLMAAETTLTGYPTGGYSITDLKNPNFAPGGGALVTSNLINIEFASGAAVVIGGYWVEDAATPTPNVREVFIYDPQRALGRVGDGWPVVVQLGYGANA